MGREFRRRAPEGNSTGHNMGTFYVRLAAVGLFLLLPISLCWSNTDAVEKKEKSSEKKKAIVLSEEERQRIPVIGSLTLSPHSNKLKVDFGPAFSGSELLGRVVLKNGFGKDLQIESASTTCGCTAAYSTTEPIPSGTSAELLTNVKVSKVGEFGVKVTLHTTEGAMPIYLIGKVLSRVSVVESNVKYHKAASKFSFTVSLNDKAMAGKDLSVVVNGHAIQPVVKEEESYVFEIKADHVSGTATDRVIPRIGDLELSPILVRFRVPGEVKLLTHNVFLEEGEFRVMVRGDTGGLNHKTAKLQVDNSEYDVVVRPVLRGASAILICKTDAQLEDRQSATLLIGAHKFEIKVSNK